MIDNDTIYRAIARHTMSPRAAALLVAAAMLRDCRARAAAFYAIENNNGLDYTAFEAATMKLSAHLLNKATEITYNNIIRELKK